MGKSGLIPGKGYGLWVLWPCQGGVKNRDFLLVTFV